MTDQNKVPFNKLPKTLSEQVKTLKSHGLLIHNADTTKMGIPLDWENRPLWM